MNLRQFIKGHWSALIGGCLVLLLDVIQETGYVEIPLIGSQKGLNVLFLILSFLEVLSVWNCRIDSDVRHTALLQICLIACEAYIINIDVFSNSIQKWSDFIESGWNLTWIICGIFELSLISGHLGNPVRIWITQHADISTTTMHWSRERFILLVRIEVWLCLHWFLHSFLIYQDLYLALLIWAQKKAKMIRESAEIAIKKQWMCLKFSRA